MRWYTKRNSITTALAKYWMQWIYLPLEAFIREQISLQVWSHLIATQAGYVKAKTMWNGFITNLSFLWPSGLSLTILFGWISCLSLTFFRYNKMSHPKSQNSTLFWFFFQTQVRFCTFKLSSSLNLSSTSHHVFLKIFGILKLYKIPWCSNTKPDIFIYVLHLKVSYKL